MVKEIKRPLGVKYDNKALELYSKNNRSSSKLRHIDIKFLVAKERVQSFQMSIKRITTNSNIDDPLTKDLPPKVFHEHVARTGVIRLYDMTV